MAELRVAFMGTPKLACTILQALIESRAFHLVGVVTQPDRPKGRQLKVQASPVKELAVRFELPVLQPERARDPQFRDQLRRLNLELIAVAAYGQILPREVLELPRLGCLNVHTSLLPKYRGAAPIQWAILNDERQTGVTIIKMNEGLDTGPILSQAATEIAPEDTAETLHDRLARLGADLLCQTIPGYVAGQIQSRPQPADGATYAPRIKKDDGRIDWHRPAREIWNRVRGLVPWPGAFCLMPGPGPSTPRLLKIWAAQMSDLSGPPGEVLKADRYSIIVACGEGALRILSLQAEGGRRLSAPEFLAGRALTPGGRLG